MTEFPNCKKIDYSCIREYIKSGDIMLCSGNAPFSKLIKEFTGSKWSHVGFIIRVDEIERIMVMESVESIGVRTVSLSSYINNYNGSGEPYPGEVFIFRHNDMKPEFIKDISKKAVDLLGHNYDSQEIARIMLKLTFKSFNNSVDIPKDNGEYICSEYVYECMKGIGIKFHESPGYITPSDIAKTEGMSAVCQIL